MIDIRIKENTNYKVRRCKKYTAIVNGKQYICYVEPFNYASNFVVMELQPSRLATIQRHKEQEEEERRQQEAEAEEARCFGYCDTLSPMEAGKARNALYKSVMYKGQAMKKKDFIKMLVDSGNYTAQEKFFSNYKNGKSPCYCIVHEDESFYTVSKTEYNLFRFLTEKEV